MGIDSEGPKLNTYQRIGQLLEFGEMNPKIGEERDEKIEEGLIAMEGMQVGDGEFVDALIGGDGFGFVEPVLATMHVG